MLHDGWKSRKWLATIVSLVMGVSTTSAAFFMGKMTADAYVGFLYTYVPLMLGVFSASEVTQKIGLAKADGGLNKSSGNVK